MVLDAGLLRLGIMLGSRVLRPGAWRLLLSLGAEPWGNWCRMRTKARWWIMLGVFLGELGKRFVRWLLVRLDGVGVVRSICSVKLDLMSE